MTITYYTINRLIYNDKNWQGELPLGGTVLTNLVEKYKALKTEMHYLTDEEKRMSIDRYNLWLKNLR